MMIESLLPVRAALGVLFIYNVEIGQVINTFHSTRKESNPRGSLAYSEHSS